MTAESVVLMKSRLRNSLGARRRGLSAAEVAIASRAVCHALALWPAMRSLDGAMGYSSFRNEPDIDELMVFLLESGKRLFLPRVISGGEELEARCVENLAHRGPGYCGIREPDPALCPLADLEGIGVAIVPGIAFDLRGNRLGHGKGHYDRLLPRLPKSCVFIGVCHDFQVVESVPVDSSCDTPVHWLATPSALVQCL